MNEIAPHLSQLIVESSGLQGRTTVVNIIRKRKWCLVITVVWQTTEKHSIIPSLNNIHKQNIFKIHILAGCIGILPECLQNRIERFGSLAEFNYGFFKVPFIITSKLNSVHREGYIYDHYWWCGTLNWEGVRSSPLGARCGVIWCGRRPLGGKSRTTRGPSGEGQIPLDSGRFPSRGEF